MRRVRSWATGCALLAATAGQSARADEPGFFGRLFGSAPEEPVAAAPVERPVERPAARLDPRVEAERQLSRYQEEYLRRLEVIDRFRNVALSNGDERLLAQLAQMEQQATEIFQHSIDHLPVARLRPVKALDSRLGTGVAVNPLTSTETPGGMDQTGTASRDRATDQGGMR